MTTRRSPRVRWEMGTPIASTQRLLMGSDGRRMWSISHSKDGTVTFAHIDESAPLLMTWKPGKKVVVSKPFDGVSEGVATKRFLERMVPALRGMPHGAQRREYRKMLAQLKPAKPSKPKALAKAPMKVPFNPPAAMRRPMLPSVLRRK